jgi:GNAT superfamily N-acetyltransferase
MIEVKEVSTRKQQKEFLNFALDLYKGSPYFVPPLYADEKKMFGKDYVYNGSCDWTCFMVYKDGVPAGRIQGIIQKDANAKYGEKRCRFCRFDAIDDLEVSRALFEAAETWARSKGMDTVVGPLGFSDLEREGMLVDGFQEPATFEANYNYPYYKEHMEALGYVKEVDWTGSKILGPESEEVMKEMEELNAFIFKRYKLHFGESRNGRDFMNKYAKGVFDLIDKSYDGLYGTVPFTEGMRKLMLDNYAIAINPKFAAVILDQNDRPICFGLAFPSFTRALVGTRGKYTPKVLWGMLRCLRKPEIIDLGLIGVDPEYLNRGVSGALSVAIMHMLRDHRNVKWADTNLNLEDNYAIQNQWRRFQRIEHKRFRSYVKTI